MDPDQDLLDKLDLQEGPGAVPVFLLVGSLAGLAGLVAFFTLKMELSANGELAADAGILIFVLSAVLLSVSYFRFR